MAVQSSVTVSSVRVIVKAGQGFSDKAAPLIHLYLVPLLPRQLLFRPRLASVSQRHTHLSLQRLSGLVM